MNLTIALPVIFLIAVLMTMAGRGGGNFYVLAQVAFGASMHTAASTGQLIMFCTSLAALFIFQKHKQIAWPMAILIGCTTSLMAFVGGFLAHFASGMSLKLTFASMLVVAGFLMLFRFKERKQPQAPGWGTWTFKLGEELICVKLWLVIPVSLATGLVAGMVGISGGSFLVPLMVLACAMPMKAAVGTSSVMVAATAGMGFLGHLSQGGVDLEWVLPQVAVAFVGGLIGGKLAIKTKPKSLKLLFASTTLIAAIFMYINAFAA